MGLDKGVCSECTLRSQKLRLCIHCAVKEGVWKHEESKKEFVLTVENNNIEAVLQEAKKNAICNNCALDGGQHEGHKTMQLAVLKNKLEDRVPATVEENGVFHIFLIYKTLDASVRPGVSLSGFGFSNERLAATKTGCAMRATPRHGWSDDQLKMTNCAEGAAASRLVLHNTMVENAAKVCDELQKGLNTAISSLKNYFLQFNVLPSNERKIHFNDIEASIEELNDTMSLTKDAVKRLNILNNEFQESADIVRTNSKAVTKAATMFATMDPVLVAGREKIQREAVLEHGSAKLKEKVAATCESMPVLAALGLPIPASSITSSEPLLTPTPFNFGLNAKPSYASAVASSLPARSDPVSIAKVDVSMLEKSSRAVIERLPDSKDEHQDQKDLAFCQAIAQGNSLPTPLKVHRHPCNSRYRPLKLQFNNKGERDTFISGFNKIRRSDTSITAIETSPRIRRDLTLDELKTLRTSRKFVYDENKKAGKTNFIMSDIFYKTNPNPRPFV
ncbi:hypothetical protein B9Z55_021340 [Caenorhabditis nigoni]|uniref:Uncharacterized protein n=1 Tax=Caenorhabditis nigoni TaxID=1611254 RepID=A0A2G5TRP1_9PELO|nr:hypothetical protein B9Z55_021340 [Caenorhabditis nigoni]